MTEVSPCFGSHFAGKATIACYLWNVTRESPGSPKLELLGHTGNIWHWLPGLEVFKRFSDQTGHVRNPRTSGARTTNTHTMWQSHPRQPTHSGYMCRFQY